jgi:uncharacterized protein
MAFSHATVGNAILSDKQRLQQPMAGWPLTSSPYHPGEQLVQERAGAREVAERVGRQVIRDRMPDQHREMFAKLPTAIVGSVDSDGRPWASVLVGHPGFITSPDPRHLQICASTDKAGAFSFRAAMGGAIAILGIELGTRRRNRMNGKIIAAESHSFTIEVAQSFGNCPKYIHAREARIVGSPPSLRDRNIFRESSKLSNEAVELVSRSDTFFIASCSPGYRSSNPVEGVDVNHRGGRPGFVRVTEDTGTSVLTSPDFVGNSAFNTFGNIALNPVAGLMFIDFESGGILSLTGTATVIWNAPEIAAFPGAQRLLEFKVHEGARIADAVPIRWSSPHPSQQTARTGTWQDIQRTGS